mmetsp:Transcript_45561/g.105664  ORF Transcript_45561/g.105664 Transcript_45561/m.105664 type:complete len:476 (-) Transcript_45561:41-1468(-)
MSWREESTFKKSSALSDDEKEFLKVAKKLRDVLKLEERQSGGAALEVKQVEKLSTKPALIAEVAALIAKLPAQTDVLDKNSDIVELLPGNSAKQAASKREEAERKRQEEEERRRKREQREREERDKPIFMSRHDRPILNVVSSNDGQFLFTCSKDKSIICWSKKDRLLVSVCTLGGHGGAVFGLDMSVALPGSPARLASGDAEGKVLIWPVDAQERKPGSVVAPVSSVDNGGIVRVVRWCPFDTTGDVRRLSSGSEKLGSTPATITIWKVQHNGKAEEVLKLTDLPTKPNDLRWASGAKLKLLSAHDNGYIGIWLAEAPGGLLKTIKAHTEPVTSLCMTCNGTAVVTASRDRTSVVIDVSKRDTETLATYKADRPLNAVAVSENYVAGSAGFLAVAGGQNERDVTTSKMVEGEFDIKVFDAASGENVASGKGHFGPVHALLSVPGISTAFASVAETGCLKVHSATGSLVHSDMKE